MAEIRECNQVFVNKADVESRDKARMTRWQVPYDEEGPIFVVGAFMGKYCCRKSQGTAVI